MWIKIAIQEVGPITLVAFRVLFGLIFGIAVIFIQRTPWPRTFKSWSPLLLLGLTNVAIPFFLISWGEKSIDSAVAAILDATVPLFTSLIAVPRTVVNATTGWLVESLGWFAFFILCTLLALPGMLLLFKVAPWRRGGR